MGQRLVANSYLLKVSGQQEYTLNPIWINRKCQMVPRIVCNKQASHWLQANVGQAKKRDRIASRRIRSMSLDGRMVTAYPAASGPG